MRITPCNALCVGDMFLYHYRKRTHIAGFCARHITNTLRYLYLQRDMNKLAERLCHGYMIISALKVSIITNPCHVFEKLHEPWMCPIFGFLCTNQSSPSRQVTSHTSSLSKAWRTTGIKTNVQCDWCGWNGNYHFYSCNDILFLPCFMSNFIFFHDRRWGIWFKKKIVGVIRWLGPLCGFSLKQTGKHW